MALNNYGSQHMPVTKHFDGGSARSTVSVVGLDSAALYMGQFVPFVTGADAAPSGAEFGIPAFSDDNRIWGYVTGFHRYDSQVPIQDDPQRQGSVTDATGEYPMKYTFSSSNDESNTTSAYKEMVDIMPIHEGDILEVSLWGASSVSVNRGTTTAAGTTTSSANVGVAMAVDTASAPFALLESGASKTLANQDFITVDLNGRKPRRQNRVYVRCLRAFTNLVAPE